MSPHVLAPVRQGICRSETDFSWQLVESGSQGIRRLTSVPLQTGQKIRFLRLHSYVRSHYLFRGPYLSTQMIMLPKRDRSLK